MFMFGGELAALSAALFWAIATWIYSQSTQRFGAMPLNVIKGAIAGALLLISLTFFGWQQGAPSGHAWTWLIVSGIVGIAIGDTAYFAALRRIGPRKTLLLEALAPPLTGVLALLILNEALSWQAALGILIALAGIIYVLRQQSDNQQEPLMTSSGLGFGVLAAVCQATGVLMSHYALVDAEVSPLWGAFVRLSAGTGVILLLVVLRKELSQSLIKPLFKLSTKNAAVLFFAIFTGTFLAIWLQQVSLKYADAAVAQTLMATSPLFALPIALIRGQRLTWRIWAGTLFAFVGVCLLIFG
ncbi:DMT family transporter [Corallincola platygyrae]|uniref:DMT family transporter n=1 Tax=Corallincola platygyrae TaxID=1193278 RepID=A0ABW4XMJ8_9GAMM